MALDIEGSDYMEHLTWEEIVEKYPDRWVVLTNCNMLYGGIQDADVIAVLMNDEVDDFRLANWGKGYYYERTTEKTGVGIINVKGVELTVD